MRIALVGFWALFQAGSQELLASMQRLPSWQDLHYLADPSFIKNSTQGLHLASPVLSGVLLVSALLSGFFTIRPPAKRFFFHRPDLGWRAPGHSGTARPAFGGGQHRRPLQPPALVRGRRHRHPFQTGRPGFADDGLASQPENPRSFRPSLLSGKGRAKNVLIITLEGIPGLYYPQIRQAMGVPAGPFEMQELAQNTPDATLVPDFVTHSHQTIRGLYAMLCGDFSKFSYEMSKASRCRPMRRGPAPAYRPRWPKTVGRPITCRGRDWPS